MPAWTTPLLWPVCPLPTRSAASSTTSDAPGWRRCSSRAVARPTMPAPTTTMSAASRTALGSRAIVHVGLNAVFLQPRFGGIETYVRELANALVEERTDLRLTVFVKPGVEPEGLPAAARTVSHPLIGRRFTSAVSEALLLGRLAAREGVDVLHSTAMTGPLRSPVPHVVTVHDLIWKDVPDSPDPVTTRLWRTVVPPIVRAADRVLCVSQSTGDDVVARLGVERDRVDVVHEGFGTPARATPLPER